MKNPLVWITSVFAIALLSVGAYILTTTKVPLGQDTQNLPPLAASSGSSLDNLKPTDYAKKEHWLSLPTDAEKPVDVFYLYPTSWKKVDQNEPNVCAVDNPIMLKMSKLAFERTATAFEPVGNIYAPYYKQDDMFYMGTLSTPEQNAFVQKYVMPDVIAAFDYYIKNYNQGRPFILAGHSQGSHVLSFLLSGYMKENPEVYQRMVAAYVIGYSITQEYLAQNPHLKFAQGEGDTGVIISYNTEAKGMTGQTLVMLTGALAINPISWTRDETLAPASQNLGSILLNKDKSIKRDEKGHMIVEKNLADARVDKKRGTVVCSSVDPERFSTGNPLFPKGVYHSFDYAFYYYNLRDNALTRVKNFVNEKN